MATYSQLLLDAGGGIIDRSRQSERQEGASVVIGLGGTGTDAVLRLKREMFKQLKSDDPEAAIPTYKSIKYLVVDSNEARIRSRSGKITDIDKNTEFFSLAYDYNLIRTAFRAKNVMDSGSGLDWLDYEYIGIDDQYCYSGGIRAIGRLLLVARAEALYARLKSAMEEALSGAKVRKLDICICAGLSGGLGGGTFLDVCYLTRKALQEIGKPESNVCGCFFLPDVNLSLPGVSEDPLISKYIRVNGYAALRELDYCMDFGRNKDSFKMDYGFMKIDCNLRPVDMCFLISAVDSEAVYVSNAYQKVMGLATDFMIMMLTEEGSIIQHFGSICPTALRDAAVWHGACKDYYILGVSSVTVPFSEIASFLGWGMFESFREIYDKTPTQEECDRFLVNCQLQYDDIYRSLLRGCAMTVIFPDDFDAKMYRTSGDGGFVSRAMDFLHLNKKEMKKNCRAMIRDFSGNFIPSGENISLIDRTYKGLYDLIIDIDHGIFYAERLLGGCVNRNLIYVIDEAAAGNRERLSQAEWQMRRLEEECREAKRRMDSAGLLNGKRLLDEYKMVLSNLYVTYFRVETFKTMEFILKEYKRQVSELRKSFFQMLTTVFDTLRETFTENLRTCESSSARKLVSVNEIRDDLAEEVRKLDPKKTYYDLISHFIQNYGKWKDGDENWICRLAADVIRNGFHGVLAKNMADYLRGKFQTDNPMLLTDKIKTNIIEDKLWKDSEPSFWLDPMYRQWIFKGNYLMVPFDATEIIRAANDFAGHEATAVIESHITDRILMMNIWGGIPLFACRGIQELEAAYETGKKPGRHLYEKGKVNWNEILPSPIPASLGAADEGGRTAKKNEMLLAEFARAEKEGIVQRDAMGNWYINRTEDLDLRQCLRKETGGRETAGLDKEELYDVICKVEAIAEEVKKRAEPVRIEHPVAVEGREKQVMLDVYLRSPVLNRMVRKELEKKAVIDAGMAELKEQFTAGGKELREKPEEYMYIFPGR